MPGIQDFDSVHQWQVANAAYGGAAKALQVLTNVAKLGTGWCVSAKCV